jgi:hypothetical protein
MAYEIVIGRSTKDKEKYGLKGSIFIGRHYVKMGQTRSLSSDIYLDVNKSHVFFICGKRGSGKSYTMGAIAEGMADLPKEVSSNIAVLIFDTMGIYWTMKYPNHKDEDLLKQWNLEGKGLDVKIYTPTGYFKKYKDEGIPTDAPFSIQPSELAPIDWAKVFEINPNKPEGVLLERVIHLLKKTKENYSLKDIINAIKKDQRADGNTKELIENLFEKAKAWGLFSIKGTKIKDLIRGGQVSVLDLSVYATIPGSWEIKAMVIGIISQRLFIERMIAKKGEEYTAVHKAERFFAEEEEEEKRMPLVWLMLDEAHEFLPREGETAASDALITILREGRQPGISLVLVTQQPGKIHTDVMTQADTVIAHRLTAKIDVEALGTLMQSYMRRGLDEELNVLPDITGAAIIFDDMNEKMYPMQVRPRFTWHGGEAPIAMEKAKKEIIL